MNPVSRSGLAALFSAAQARSLEGADRSTTRQAGDPGRHDAV